MTAYFKDGDTLWVKLVVEDADQKGSSSNRSAILTAQAPGMETFEVAVAQADQLLRDVILAGHRAPLSPVETQVPL